MLVKADNMLL